MRAILLLLMLVTMGSAQFILLSRAGEFPFGKVVWAEPVGDPSFDDQPVGRKLDFRVKNVKVWGEPNGAGGMLGYHVVVAGILGERYTFGGSPYAYVDGKVHRSAQLGFHPQSNGLGEYKASPGEHFMGFWFETREDAVGFAAQVRAQIELDKGEQAGAGQPAIRSESDSEGGDKPQPESEGRSR